MDESIKTVVQVENVNDLPEYRGSEPLEDYERFRKTMETILNNNPSPQQKDRDITPIDLSPHAGIQDLIQMTEQLRPIVEETTRFYALMSPSSGESKSSSQCWM
jgi:hypothetical protein